MTRRRLVYLILPALIDRRNPEFQKLLKRNMERHAHLLKMLADG